MIENEIISRVINKERAAQSLIYQKYQTTWYMICLRYQKNKDDALDCLQNGLIKIFSKIDQFDVEKGNFKAWSCKVVVNENLMFLRKKGNSFKVYDVDEVTFIPNQSETALDILSAEELTKMVQNLPNGYRTVFNLFVIEGFSHQEIAEILDISIGASKSQLFKARKLLQKKLEVLLEE